MQYEREPVKAILICSQETFTIDTELVPCSNQKSSSIWISPEFTRVFFFTAEEYSQDNIIELDIQNDHISEHRIENLIVIIAIEQSAWMSINAKVKKYRNIHEDTYLYYLDLWLLEEAIRYKSSEFSLENVKYIYTKNERIELYGHYENKSITPNQDTTYIASKIEKSKINRILKYINISLFCCCLLLIACIAKMGYTEKKYINIYNQEVSMNKKIIGYTSLGQHNYFKDLINPLINIQHPYSYINIIAANAINNSILILGSITNSTDLQNWSKLRKFNVYKNIDLSILEYHKGILKLDSIFKIATDEKYDNKSILLIQKPDMISGLESINIQEISKNLFART